MINVINWLKDRNHTIIMINAKKVLIKPMSLHGKSLEETKNERNIAQHNKVYAAKLC